MMLPQLLAASWGLVPPRGRMLEHPRPSITFMEGWGCTTSMLACPCASSPVHRCHHHLHGLRVEAWLGAQGAQPWGNHSATAPCTRGPAHLAADI